MLFRNFYTALFVLCLFFCGGKKIHAQIFAFSDANACKSGCSYNEEALLENTFTARLVSNTSEDKATVMQPEALVITNLSIQVYPNPTANYLMINLPEAIETKVELMNEQGVILQQLTLHGTHLQLNVMAYAAGYYSLKLIQKDKCQVVKILKY